MDFPSNSINPTGGESTPPKIQRPIPTENDPESPVPHGEKKEIKKVVAGKAIKRKRTLGERIISMFASEGKSIGRSIVDDILKPAFRDTISDAIIQGVERAVYGEVQSTTRRTARRGPVGNSNHISYNRYSMNDPYRPRQEPRRDVSPRARGGHHFDEIELGTRAEGQAILQQMDTIIRRYQHVSIADLYEMAGLEAEFTDEKWGWTDLYGADVRRTRSGNYALILPPAEAIG